MRMAPSAPLGGPQQAASARDERPALTPWPPGSLCTTWRRRRRCTATASRPTPSSSRRPRQPRAASTPSTGAPPPGAAPGCGSPCASPHAQAYQGPGWPALPEQALSSVCLCTVPVTVWPRCRAQSLLTYNADANRAGQRHAACEATQQKLEEADTCRPIPFKHARATPGSALHAGRVALPEAADC